MEERLSQNISRIRYLLILYVILKIFLLIFARLVIEKKNTISEVIDSYISPLRYYDTCINIT